MLALDHHESVVALGERRVDVSGVISCHVEGLAHTGITGLGDALVSRHQSGLVDLGHKASEGAHGDPLVGSRYLVVELAQHPDFGQRCRGPTR